MAIDDERDEILSETDRLSAESHIAVARSLIVLEEIRALRRRDEVDPEAVFETISERQLRRLEASAAPDGEASVDPVPGEPER